jgi:hypothetical protein
MLAASVCVQKCVTYTVQLCALIASFKHISYKMLAGSEMLASSCIAMRQDFGADLSLCLVEHMQQDFEHFGLLFNCITSIIVETQSYHL